jgi:hypothetical protein
MRKSFIALVFLAICPILLAQQTLNNDAVVKLVKAGLSDDLIISTITAQTGVYDTSTDGLIALKSAGVSDKVVSAMVAKDVAPAPVPAPPPIPIANPAAVPPPAPQSTVAPPPAPQVPPPPPFHSTDGKIRVYVTDHPIFESNGIGMASGDRHNVSAAAVSHTQAGDDPRTVEVQADILKVCPAFVMASNNPDRADYVLVFRRRGGARSSMFAFGGLYGLAFSAAMKVDGASLFQNDGDMVYATKQTTVEKSIRDICDHIPPPTLAPATAQAPSPVLAPIPPPPPPPAATPTAN